MSDASVQQRLVEPRFPHMQILRYMGNKRSILEFIIPLLEEQVEPADVVLDLFAGTCAVGYALKRRQVVYANDIQEYAYVISRALLSNDLGIGSVTQAKAELQEHYYSNLEALQELLGDQIKHERRFLDRRVDNFLFASYRAFCTGYPYYGNPNGNTGRDQDFLHLFSKENIERYRAKPRKTPYILFSTYFANSYFGVQQCAQIDSLRYAIDQVEDETRRTIYLTCLISALSNAVSSTGHFAQFRNVNSVDSCQAILEERAKPIPPMFYDKLREFVGYFVENGHFDRENRCFNLDYRELLRDHREELKHVSLIYADPPYSSAHYSRFYHVPETLIKYDYPENDFVGRYRHDRPTSDFCKYSTVEGEFRKLFHLTSTLGVPVAVSYSSKGMIPIEKIRRIANRHFGQIRLESQEHKHSRQGRPSNIALHEYLLLCERPRGR